MGKKVYKCDLRDCEKLFSSKFSLKRHNLIHLNSKKHICKHCQKAFVLPQYLEEHEYTHTGAKPFTCNINGCTEQFRQRGKLSIHRKNAHPDQRENQNFMAGPNSMAQNNMQNEFQINKMLSQENEEEKNEIVNYNHNNQQQSLLHGMRMQQNVNSNLISSVPSHQLYGVAGDQPGIIMGSHGSGAGLEQMLMHDRNLYSQDYSEKLGHLHSQMHLNQIQTSKLLQAQDHSPQSLLANGVYLDNKQYSNNIAQQNLLVSQLEHPDLHSELNNESNPLSQFTPEQLQKLLNQQALSSYHQSKQQNDQKISQQQQSFNIKQGSGQTLLTQELVNKIQNLQQVRSHKEQHDLPQIKLPKHSHSIDQITKLTNQQINIAQQMIPSEFTGNSRKQNINVGNSGPLEYDKRSMNQILKNERDQSFGQDNRQLLQGMNEDAATSLRQQIVSQQIDRSQQQFFNDQNGAHANQFNIRNSIPNPHTKVSHGMIGRELYKKLHPEYVDDDSEDYSSSYDDEDEEDESDPLPLTMNIKQQHDMIQSKIYNNQSTQKTNNQSFQKNLFDQ